MKSKSIAALSFAVTVMFAVSALAQTPPSSPNDPKQDPGYQQYLKDKAAAKQKAANDELAAAFDPNNLDYSNRDADGISRGLFKLDQISKALADGADANAQIKDNPYNSTHTVPALEIPATSGAPNSADAARLLIKAGANINPSLDDGDSLLFKAVSNQASDPALVRELMAIPTLKQVLNQPSQKSGMTCIQAAFQAGNIPVIQELIAAGPSATDSNGQPLEILRYLSDKDQNAFAKLAMLAESFVGIDALKRDVSQPVGGKLFLNQAIQDGKLTVALFYAQNLGASPILKDAKGNTAKSLTIGLLDKCVGIDSCDAVQSFKEQLWAAAGIKDNPNNPRDYPCLNYINCQLGFGGEQDGPNYCTDDYIQWSKKNCSPVPEIVD